MGTDVLYDDGLAVLDRDGVTLRRYYFPLGMATHIPYGRIRAGSSSQPSVPTIPTRY